MISQTAEYALRAIVYLADNDDAAHTADKLSGATQVPAGYLAKILQSLAKSGLIRSQRGPYGGFTLERPKTELTVYDVINAIDPIRRIHSCPLELETHTSLCPLHSLLDGAAAQLEKTFKKVTIASLLSDRKAASHPLCNFPRHAVGQDLAPVKRT